MHPAGLLHHLQPGLRGIEGNQEAKAHQALQGKDHHGGDPQTLRRGIRRPEDQCQGTEEGDQQQQREQHGDGVRRGTSSPK